MPIPFAGIGLHVIIALFCAIHAVRTHQQLYWLFILFAFPLLGSAVYFIAIYLPNSGLKHGALKAAKAASRVMDPSREVREARDAFEEAPTAQNRMRLAAALLAGGDAEESALQYESCLKGLFAKDPEIRFGAARAFVACDRFEDALRYLEPLRLEQPDYKAEAVALLLARAHAGSGRHADAKKLFESAIEAFGTYESKAEYAIWAYLSGNRSTAERLHAELDKIASRWNSLTRDLNAPVTRRLTAARALKK